MSFSGPKTIIIVGGGLAGLYMAYCLSSMPTYYKYTIHVLEAKSHLGGRLGTVYANNDNTQEALADTGAWRIPATHTKFLKLLKELNIALQPFNSATHNTTNHEVQGMSVLDINIALKGVEEALHSDLEKGYMDQSDAASGTKPYFTDSTTFFVPTRGFQYIIHSLQIRLNSRKNVKLHTNTLVQNVAYHQHLYHLKTRERVQNTFFVREFKGKNLIIAIPPRHVRLWKVCRDYFSALPCAVKSVPLHHIYVKNSAGPQKHIKNGGRLGQVVPRTKKAGKSWWQVSYSSGRLAKFWNRLKLSYPKGFKQLLKYSMKEVDSETYTGENDFVSFMHEDAIHIWHPVPFFDIKKSVEKALQPNKYQLPSCFYVGEAFSSYQGWCEGVMQTCEKVLDKMVKGDEKESTDLHTCFGGVPLEVEKLVEWSRVHPGSEQAIQKHFGEDVLHYMQHQVHSDFAYACVWQLQR